MELFGYTNLEITWEAGKAPPAVYYNDADTFDFVRNQFLFG